MGTGETKERILQIGLRLLRSQSYNSFSFADIAEKVGINKASIYYYFPTKEVLGIALVKYYKSKIISYIEMIKDEPSARKRLDAFVNFFKVGLEKQYLCPAGVLSVEYFTLPQEMQDELRILFNFYLDWLTEVCRDGLETAEFSFKGDPRDIAFHISTSIQGATAMARAYGTIDLYHNSLEFLLDQV